VGNTTMTRRAVHPITVRQIDMEKRKVFASWNYNPPAWHSERQVTRWKVNKPQADPL
jgi:hypothetical protein